MTTRTSAAALAAAWLLAPAPARGGDGPAPAATLTAARLRSLLAEGPRRLTEFLVVYRSGGGVYAGPEYPPGTYLQRTVAAKWPASLYHLSAHGHAALDWRDDPLQQRCHVSGGRWWVERPVNRTYLRGTLRPGDGLPGSMADEFLFQATGWWPFDRPAPKYDGLPYMLRDVAECDRYDHVRPTLERADDRWCHVLERPGVDRLWIDAERGGAVLARERCHAATGVVMARFELDGHREVDPGLWLPTRIRNIQYDYTARTEEGRRRPVIDAPFELLEVRTGPLDDALFEFTPPPGAVLLTADGPARQTVPGGLDHLDHLAGWVGRYSAGRETPAAESGLGWLAGLPALGLVGVLELWVRRGRRPT